MYPQQPLFLPEKNACLRTGIRQAIPDRDVRPEVIAFVHHDVVHERRLPGRQREGDGCGVAAGSPGLTARAFAPRGAHPLNHCIHAADPPARAACSPGIFAARYTYDLSRTDGLAVAGLLHASEPLPNPRAKPVEAHRRR
jgi:hypothetical protein